MLKKTLTISAVVALLTVGSMAKGHYGQGKGHHGQKQQEEVLENNTTVNPISLNETQIAGLALMAEEEKVARDVYLHFAETTEERIFSNIAKSEQKHIDAVLKLLETYELEAPSTMDEAGIYLNEELQELYNVLIEKGDNSLIDALEVGVELEEKDIEDLEAFLDEELPSDIEKTYTRLLRGSLNHLRAFNRQLSK